MPAAIDVTVHASQFPDSVSDGLLEGLRTRRFAPRFHYQTYKQAQLWLALHRAFSPAWLDSDCAAVYDRGFAAAAAAMPDRPARLIGLGCGGGYKEARLLCCLAARGRELSYVPCDVSLALVLAAAREAREACPGLPCHPLLCDIARAADLPEILDRFGDAGARRIITFFGMIPNFEPDHFLPRLAALARAGDILLFSANLAPGPDYRAGVQRVLPGYDNPETRAWLLALLYDLGVEPGDGVVEFSVEAASGLYRIAADFRFSRERVLTVHDERFAFTGGDVVRLFFSYRHTADGVPPLLRGHQWEVTEQWITASGEEGVFLCRKKGG